MLIKEINLFQLQAQVGFEKNSTAIFNSSLYCGDNISKLMGDYKNKSMKGSETRKMIAELKGDLNKIIQNLYEVGVNRFLPVDRISAKPAVYADYLNKGVDENTAWDLVNLNDRIAAHKNQSAEIAIQSTKCTIGIGLPSDLYLPAAALRELVDKRVLNHRHDLAALWEKLKPLNDLFRTNPLESSNSPLDKKKIMLYLRSLEGEQAAEIYNFDLSPREALAIRQELLNEWTEKKAHFEQYFEKSECMYEKLFENGNMKLTETLKSVYHDLYILDSMVGVNDKEQARIDALIGYREAITEGVHLDNISALSRDAYQTRVAENQEALKNAFKK